MSSQLRWAAIISLLSFATLLPLLDFQIIFQVSEAREGVVVNEILSSGECILPLRNGEIVPSKPILFHWVAALCGKVLGVFDEFALRLPSVLAATGILVLIFFLTAKLGGIAAGVLAAAMLLTSYGFFRLAQDGRVDMVFTFFAVGAIVAWMSPAIDEMKRRNNAFSDAVRALKPFNYLLVAFLCGLAVLAKGPLGLVLPGLIITTVVVAECGWKRVFSLVRPEWIFALLIPLPWYYAAATVGKEGFIGRQLIFENVQRFMGGEGITEKGSWFYLPHLIAQGAPWSVLLLLYLIFLFRGYRLVKRGVFASNPFLPTDRLAKFGIRFGFLWCLAVIIFLTLSAGKRRAYLLPILPAIAMILSLRIMSTWKRLVDEGKLSRFSRILGYEGFTWGLLVWIFVVGLGWLALFTDLAAIDALLPIPQKLLAVFKVLPIAVERGGFPLKAIYLLSAVGSIGLWSYAFKKKRFEYAAAGIFVLLQLVFSVYVNTGMGVKGFTHTYRFYAERVAQAVPATTKINFIKTIRDESFDGFFFYFNRHVTMIDPKVVPNAPGTYLARRSWIVQQSREWRSRMNEIFEGGRLADDPGEELVLFRWS